MMDELQKIWPYLIRMVPSGVVLSGILVLYVKTKVPSTLVMFVGQLMIFLTIPIQSILFMRYTLQIDQSFYSTAQSIIGGVSLLAYLAFGIALIVFATSYFKNKSKNSTLDSF